MPGAQLHGSGNGPTYLLSRRWLQRVLGASQKGAHWEVLDTLNLRDVEQWIDDFNGTALDTTNDYNVAAGATATTWATLSGGQNGRIRGISGTTAATSGLQIYRGSGAQFLSAQNIGIEVLFYASVVTNTRFEIGFVNAVPSVNTTIVNSLSTPTFNTVTDGCVYCFDNASSTNTSEMVTISSVSSGQANKVTCSPANNVTAATAQHVRLEIKGQNCFLWLNGQKVAEQSGTGASSAVNSATALIPVIMSHKKADTTTSNIDIDYVRIWSDRLTQSS